jgi:hypothetical protein
MLGQAIGRWGNFVNAEAYGWSEGVDKLPWRMVLDYYVIDGKKNPVGVNCVHPTFIYESLWNVLGLAIILFILYRKKKFNGEIMLWYFTWYGIGRAFIETLRTDSLYLGNTDIRVSSLLGALCFVLLMPLLIAGRIRFAKMTKAGVIAADKPADFPVLLGIVKPEPMEKAPETPDEDDIIDIADTPSVSGLLKEEKPQEASETNENKEENAENGETEE